jgi:hypothetical protein
MAETWFTPKEWKARLVEFAGRRLLRNVANGETTTYDVSRSEGQISQEGDAFNTKNMNDLEQRISNGFANAKTNIDALNSDLGGCSLEQENGNFYIVGADAVRKKLGSNGIAYLGEMPYTCAKDYGECTLLTFCHQKSATQNVTIKNLNGPYNIRQIIPAHIGVVLCFLAIVDVTNLNKGATIDTDSSDTKRVFIIQ